MLVSCPRNSGNLNGECNGSKFEAQRQDNAVGLGDDKRQRDHLSDPVAARWPYLLHRSFLTMCSSIACVITWRNQYPCTFHKRERIL